MVKIQNVSNQVLPLIIPNNKTGGDQISLRPRQTVSLAIDKPTEQMKRLKHKGLLKVK